MRLPILAYGHPLLRQQCLEVETQHPGLETLIQDMWDTMKGAKGCGLAAPQVGQSIRLFIVDSKTTFDNLDEADRVGYFDPADTGIVETFINPRIVSRSDNVWEDEEGCLSIPRLQQKVSRPWSITVEYLDASLQKRKQSFYGATARMIQHEYDHVEGVLYIDHLKPLARKLMSNKLNRIMQGKIETTYPMKFS